MQIQKMKAPNTQKLIIYEQRDDIRFLFWRKFPVKNIWKERKPRNIQKYFSLFMKNFISEGKVKLQQKIPPKSALK